MPITREEFDRIKQEQMRHKNKKRIWLVRRKLTLFTLIALAATLATISLYIIIALIVWLVCR